jgi:hypothetical protein
MYSYLFINEENTSTRNTLSSNCNFDGRLCCELCVVFMFISGVCSVYLLFFIHFASESNPVNISLT